MSTLKLTSNEKAELLKDTIYQLYSKEGRSFSYIGKLIGIDRKVISKKVNEWEFPAPNPQRHLSPSNQKFVNKNRQFIKSCLDQNITETEIARRLGVSRAYLTGTILPNDEVLLRARNDYAKRIKNNANLKRQNLMDNSSFDYNIIDMDGEIWKPILGYDGYMVSNFGRVKHYAKNYNAYHLLKTQTCLNGDERVYVDISADGKRHNFQLSRLVAHAFCDGYSSERNTVNHKDGNVQNNCADNLEWMSQSENNKHSYEYLGREKVRVNKMPYKKIIYMDKYEFKTIAAFSRFLNKSETQTRRYLDTPEKYNIKLVS